MNFNLVLFQGTDIIKFGMTSSEIRNILKVEPTLFKKLNISLFDTEAYDNICHVYYEKQNNEIVCSAFEFLMPSKVFLDDVQLMRAPRKDIEKLFKNKFDDCEIDSSGISSFKGDFGVYFNKGRVESVYISRKGYRLEEKEFYEKNNPIENYVNFSVPEGMSMYMCPVCFQSEYSLKAEMCLKCNVMRI